MNGSTRDIHELLSREICGICDYYRFNNSCRIRKAGRCQLIRYLPRIANAIVFVRQEGTGDYFKAIREVLCGMCPQSDSPGGCKFRGSVPAAMVVATFLQVPSVKETTRNASSDLLVVEALENAIDIFRKQPANKGGRQCPDQVES